MKTSSGLRRQTRKEARSSTRYDEQSLIATVSNCVNIWSVARFDCVASTEGEESSSQYQTYELKVYVTARRHSPQRTIMFEAV